MSQFLLVSLKNPYGAENPDELTHLVSSLVGNLGTITDFHVKNDMPLFTSQDQLVNIADDLSRLDTTTLGILSRFSRNIQDLNKKVETDNRLKFPGFIEDKEYQLEQPVETMVKIDDANIYQVPEYLKKWKWVENQFDTSKSINEVKDKIVQEVAETEGNTRAITNSFTEASNAIVALRRRNEGTLATRNLEEVASALVCVTSVATYKPTTGPKKPIFVQTPHLQTVFVVIKKAQKKEFETDYRAQSTYVVPVAPQFIEEDTDHFLYAVTLLRDNIDDYQTFCKEKRWTLKVITYKENMKSQMKADAINTIRTYQQTLGTYSDALVNGFSHLFVVWMHIKALRAYAESKLLYGIKSPFQCYMIETTQRNIPKIHKALEERFSDGLDDSNDKKDDDDDQMEDADLEHSYFANQINLIPLLPAK